MAWSKEAWLAAMRARLGDVRAGMSAMGANSAYGFVAAATLWPVVQAAATSGEPMAALLGVAGGVGGNVLATWLERWRDRASAAEPPAQLATEIVEGAARDKAFLKELHDVFRKLKVPAMAGTRLSEEDRQWFAKALAQEVAAIRRGDAAVVLNGDLQVGGVRIGDFKDSSLTIHGPVAGRDVNIYNPPAPDPEKVRQQEALERYLTKLAQRCNVLPLVELGAKGDAASELTLEDVYVMPDTEEGIEEELEDGALSEWGDQSEWRSLSAFELMTAQRRLALLGLPGSGKSSAVRIVAGALAKGCAAQKPLADGWEPCLLPLLVVLRELAPRLAALPLGEVWEANRRLLRDALWAQWRAELAEFGAEEAEPRIEQALIEGAVFLVFDGLDEVAEEQRERVRWAVRALVESYPKAARIVVSCRTRSYHGAAEMPGFHATELAPFDEEKIQRFVANFYGRLAARGRLKRADAERRRDDLVAQALDPERREFAENPMLLMTMALLHQQNVTLPRERVKLYAEMVRLLMSRWQKQRGIAVSPALATLLNNEQKLRLIMQRVAYALHGQQARTKARGGMERRDLLDLLSAPELLGATELPPQRFVNYLDERAGLLVGQGGGEDGRAQLYDFPHRTFQEYLAGCEMVRGGTFKRPAEFRRRAAEGDFWSLAAQLGAEELFHGPAGESDVVALACALCPDGREPAGEAAWRALLWSGRMAALVGGEALARAVAEEIPGAEGYRERLIPRLVRLMEGPGTLEATERAEAGRALAVLGDPRPGVRVRPDGLPDMAWVRLEGGTFPIGGDQEVWQPSPAREVTLAPFWMAKYPVTTAQWQAFLDDPDGYPNERWWREAGVPMEEPEAPRWPEGNHPRVNVSWYEAMAYCRWLSVRLGVEVRLPTEEEWERAARGAEERIFPWGNEWDAARANTYESRLGRTTPVGMYAAGATPEGIHDLAGNVWEWIVKFTAEGKVDITSGPRRGGSWGDYPQYARAVWRDDARPSFRLVVGGFRVVSSSPSAPAVVPLNSEPLDSDL